MRHPVAFTKVFWHYMLAVLTGIVPLYFGLVSIWGTDSVSEYACVILGVFWLIGMGCLADVAQHNLSYLKGSYQEKQPYQVWAETRNGSVSIYEVGNGNRRKRCAGPFDPSDNDSANHAQTTMAELRSRQQDLKRENKSKDTEAHKLARTLNRTK